MKSTSFRSAKWSVTNCVIGVMLAQIILFGGVAFLWDYFQVSGLLEPVRAWVAGTSVGLVVQAIVGTLMALSLVIPQRPAHLR